MTSSSPKSLADPSMLAKIDKLFACNVGHYIDLPQIVVVGDQSSGKSSVLEGLTRLPFPRDSGLCTRFATQITFRRSTNKSITVSVIPGKDAAPDHVDALRAWEARNVEELGGEQFASIMLEAQQLMGIAPRNKNGDGANKAGGTGSTSNGVCKTFSSDVLSIQVSGPDEEHLTVIDVPGIFQKATEGLTTKEDIEFVRGMVEGYMANSRSIMLTVVPANGDVANQGILQIAEEMDKEGERTLGVLTKPDLVDKGAEKSVVDMVEGKIHRLRLGWFLVKNPGQAELKDAGFDRYAAEEKFFRKAPHWSSLPKERVGVMALRATLQEVLAKHIQHEFPKVRLEINRKLKKTTAELGAYGPERDTPNKQSGFLISIADDFQNIVGKALMTKYTDDCFVEHPELKIATLIVKRDELFSQEFATHGHRFVFWTHGEEDQKSTDAILGKDVRSAEDEDGDYEDDKIRTKGLLNGEANQVNDWLKPTSFFLSKIPTRRNRETEELGEILYPGELIARPRPRGILRWIGGVYEDSRGFELGQFEPSLLAVLLKEQTKNWPWLALGYTSDIVVITHTFIDTLLKHVCPSYRTYQKLKLAITESLMERYQRALSQVNFILEVERFGIPATQNHYFNENLQKSRQDREHSAASAKAFFCPSTKTDVVRITDLKNPRTMSNKDHTIQDLHDILASYYKVARKRIVDNVCMQAASYHLVSGPDTPLKLFSPAFVGGLSDEQLQEICGEDAFVQKARTRLLKEIEDLQNGKRILG